MNSNYHLTWIGRHEGRLRDIARGVGKGDESAIEIAAGLFASMLPNDCLLVPMPSHEGKATTMRSVCMRIVNVHGRGEMFDYLECEPHESNHAQKKAGYFPSPIYMKMANPWHKTLSSKQASGIPVFVLDNVIGTGVTASAALAVLPQATVFAITKG